MRLEKKDWISPRTNYQEFVPNEYCAPCGDGPEEVTYFFQCNAGLYTTWQEVYQETNGIAGLQTSGNIWQGYSADTYLNDYHACNATHQVKVDANTPFNIDEVFPLGYVLVPHQSGWQTTYEVLPVRIWRGENGRNVHCTTNIGEEHYVPHNPS